MLLKHKDKCYDTIMVMKKLILVLTFFFLFFFPTIALAQTPTPLPGRMTCGIAGIANKENCCDVGICSTQKYKTDVKNQIPDLLDPIVDFIPDVDCSSLPLVGESFKECRLGEPDRSSGSCLCRFSQTPTPVKSLKEICERHLRNAELTECNACVDKGGILTGVGCIPLNLGTFITDFLLGRMIGLAGVVAILCIIYAAYILVTSQGNPEKIKKAQELLTSCIMGLMLIIFSVFILRLIGVDILKIPGLSNF